MGLLNCQETSSSVFFVDATVFKLLVNDQIIKDAGGDRNFKVKIDLIGIPSLIVSRNEPTDEGDDYCSGRACHFVAKLQDIVNDLKRKPLRIGVFKTGETFPVCHGVVPFSGCVCDLVSERMNESGIFEFAANFNLVDPGDNPAGFIHLKIFLTNLGSHFVSHFALDDDDSFILKNKIEGPEYKCGSKYSIPKDSPLEESSKSCEEFVLKSLMPEIVGICLDAVRLSQGKPKSKSSSEPLEEVAKISESPENRKSSNMKKTKKKKTES